MMIDLDAEKAAVDTVRRCQRNWDLTNGIPEEHIQHWIYMATHSPSKQDEGYFNLYVLTDRELIDRMVKHTWGHTIPVIPKVVRGLARNPQMGASAYFLFASKDPSTVRTCKPNGEWGDPTYYGRTVQNKYTSIGLAMGMIALSAANMGYSTGFNKCHGQDNSPDHGIWRETLGLTEGENIEFGLGIGHGQEGRAHYETDETEFLVGVHPSPMHSVHDQKIPWNGVEYDNPVKAIGYTNFSEMYRDTKDIKVFRF